MENLDDGLLNHIVSFSNTSFYAMRRKNGVDIMRELSSNTKRNIRCPECSNYVMCTTHNGKEMGQCPVCKAIISLKQVSNKKIKIRIRKLFVEN